MRLFSGFILLVFFTSPAQAQEEPPAKTGGLEIRIGMNTFGPVHRMKKLMVENNFDETTSNWFTGGDIIHPKCGPTGFTAQISLSQSLNPVRNIGFILNYSYLRQVTGYSLVAEFLAVSFSDFSLAAPVYGFELSGEYEGIEFKVGPAVMLNMGKETWTGKDPSGRHPEEYTRISPGLFAGSSVILWDKHLTYGKLELQYMSGIPLKMGPFVAENFWGDTDEIPESGYWFGYVNLLFSFGFHL